jgi:hypothetical protein
MNYRISQSQLARLEEISKPIDSEFFPGVTFCIRNDELGMNLIVASNEGTEDIPIHKDMIPVLKEAIWIWEYHCGKVELKRSKRRE